jgi:hypothetical protein
MHEALLFGFGTLSLDFVSAQLHFVREAPLEEQHGNAHWMRTSQCVEAKPVFQRERCTFGSQR